MDKGIIGQWYKEEFGETLNIFDETPSRMKMSFSSSGYYNFEPNCVYEKDGEFCFEINDEQNRMIYHLKYEDGCLKGYYTRFGKTFFVDYKRVSDIPEDAEFIQQPTAIYVPQTNLTRIEVLKQYAAYDKSCDDIPEGNYVLYGLVPTALSKYGFEYYYDDIPANSDDIAFATLDYVCEHFGHDGSSGLGHSRSIEGQIIFAEEHEGKINCRGLAILLAALLRLKGIKARHITCMPFEEPFDDCHVVVDCLLPSGKRVMLDPTNHLFNTDKNGEYVSLQHLREMLIDGETLVPNEKASYNGGAIDSDNNRDYMIKNTFRFFRGGTFAEGVDERQIDLIPKDYVEKQVKGRKYTTNDTAFWKM